METILESKLKIEQDLNFINLIENIDKEYPNANVLDKLLYDEIELTIHYSEEGNIIDLLLDEATFFDKEKSLRFDSSRLDPISAGGVWALVTTTTVVVCYLGYKAYKTIKKYYNKKQKKYKTISNITKKTNKKCGDK